eukprot:GHUV01036722.1.p1 GENE.GHUV01036722.1~~GHUV01036722.1.p1  ORF type:complete len:137 (-),score=25.96 GHUV01036722.1:316-726(-)
MLCCAGISEGLLSGCCGLLNESVRRQVYIIRTSGARLLALINDVMDAAALRQHRPVLKQERLDLRQVVGDVSDLTRSLVDNDVSLRNDVPEGMVVWADSGRFVQVRWHVVVAMGRTVLVEVQIGRPTGTRLIPGLV